MGAPSEIQNLIAKFRNGADYFTGAGFKEMSLRSEFLNPVLKAMGWDPDNPGLDVSNREVIQEDNLFIDGQLKAPDYAFLLDGKWQWFLEAKRPGVNIETGRDSAFQIRRYSWNAGLPIGVVSDFEEWAIYDCRFEPKLGDSAAVARISYFGFEELEANWNKLVALLGRESVRQASITEFAATNPAPRGTLAVDKAFLKELSSWREVLAADVYKNNAALSVVDLNTVVQLLLDRVIFLRIAEARGLEAFGELQNAASVSDSGVYARLLSLFKRADNRYNSGLFHFSESFHLHGKPDHFADHLVVSDQVIRNIIERLYYPHPYEFSVMPADILGRVYEEFLGSKIVIRNHKATIEVKPEVRRAGGVYYTPAPIVEYIVEETLGPLLEGATPGEVAKLRILDPACGSGSFLIAAYQYLIDWHTAHYSKTPRNNKKFLEQRRDGGVRLKTSERKRILLANIFGVDVDQQAAEVAKLSLLLKVIEGQTQLELEAGRILPNLSANIQCGNSIIDLDFDLPLGITDEERLQYNPFSWSQAFPEIMASGGFDAIVGNPPYLNIDAVWGQRDPRLAYIKSRYSEIHTDKTDILFYFLARAVELCRGEISFIVSRSFLEAHKAQKLRGWLASNVGIREVLDFREAIVFPRVGINTAIIRLSGSQAVKTGLFRRYREKSLPAGFQAAHLRDQSRFEENLTELSVLGSAAWIVTDSDNSSLIAKIDSAGTYVGEFLHVGKGMETGANPVFAIPKDDRILLAAALKAGMALRRARNSDIEAFGIAENGPYLLYVEDALSFDSLPTQIQDHLKKHKDVLTARKAFIRGDCEWWRYTFPLHKEYRRRSRIYVPYRAQDSRFAVDMDAKFLGVTDTTVLYENGQPEDLNYVAAVLNSKVLTYRFRYIGKIAGNGSYEYFHNTVSKLPVPRKTPGDPDHDRLTALGQDIAHHRSVVRSTRIPQEKQEAEARIRESSGEVDAVVAKLFGILPGEQQLIDVALES